MTNGLMKPVSFGSLTFNAGSLYTTDFTVDSIKAKLRIVPLPGGGIFDADGSAQARADLPIVRRVEAYIKNATPGTVASQYQTICDDVGDRATLTGEDAGSTQWTCTARLSQVKARSSEPISSQTYFKFIMEFVQITEWVEVP